MSDAEHLRTTCLPDPTHRRCDRAVAGARARRLPLVLATVGAVLVLGAALAAPLVDRAHPRRRAGPAGAGPDARRDVGDHRPRAHHRRRDLSADPPAGGAHAPIWLACGVYDEPVRDENAVHDLEHGTVWITHDPDAVGATTSTALAEQLPDNGIMSPREGLPSPVVVTVWGAQLPLDGADDERLGLFLEEYGDGHTAPEFGVSCQGGTPDPHRRAAGAGHQRLIGGRVCRPRLNEQRGSTTGSGLPSSRDPPAIGPAEGSALQEVQQRPVELVGVADVEAVRRALRRRPARQPAIASWVRWPEPSNGHVASLSPWMTSVGHGDLGQVVAEVRRAEGLHAAERGLLVALVAQRDRLLALLLGDLELAVGGEEVAW